MILMFFLHYRSFYSKKTPPQCEQLYATKSKHSDVDGAYFGSSFPHLFCLTFPSLFPIEIPRPFIPKLFGFRLVGNSGIIERMHVHEKENPDTEERINEVGDEIQQEIHTRSAPPRWYYSVLPARRCAGGAPCMMCSAFPRF